MVIHSNIQERELGLQFMDNSTYNYYSRPYSTKDINGYEIHVFNKKIGEERSENIMQTSQ